MNFRYIVDFMLASTHALYKQIYNFYFVTIYYFDCDKTWDPY